MVKLLKCGYVIEWDDLGWMRFGDGMRFGEESLLIGLVFERDFEWGE